MKIAKNVTFVYCPDFGLLHVDFLHGSFCETCANRLLTIKAVCPIRRGNIKCVLKVFL